MTADRSELIKLLEQIGLNDAEASVYLASLEGGAQPASELASRAKLKRGHTYNLLSSLQKRGLIQEYERAGAKQFVAADPETLISILEQEEEEINQSRDELITILPALEKLRSPAIVPPKVRFYQGLDGVLEVLDDTISEPGFPLHAFLDLQKINVQLGPEHSSILDDYVNARLERGIWLYGIVPQRSLAGEDRDRGGTGTEMLREFRTLPGFSPTAEIFIYRNKVSIISTWKQKIGLTIEDESIYNTFLALHQTLWSLCSDILPH